MKLSVSGSKGGHDLLDMQRTGVDTKTNNIQNQERFDLLSENELEGFFQREMRGRLLVEQERMKLF